MDSADANWKTNPMSYKIEKRIVSKKDNLKIFLAEGGGCAVSFKKISAE